MRLPILRSALAVFDDHLWFGAGVGQFEAATSESRVRDALLEEGRRYETEATIEHHIQAHSVFPHVLVERGVLGVATLLIFAAITGVRVFRLCLPFLFRRCDDERLVVLSFLATASWISLFPGGIIQTTVYFRTRPAWRLRACMGPCIPGA